MRVDVERGFHGSVSELLLDDINRHAEVVQDRGMHVAKLMPRDMAKARSHGGRLEDFLQKIGLLVGAALGTGKDQVLGADPRGALAMAFQSSHAIGPRGSVRVPLSLLGVWNWS